MYPITCDTANFGGNRNHHMHVIRHQMAFLNPTLLLLRQSSEHFPQRETQHMMTNTGNRVTQGQFSFLPDLTDAQITAQIKYALKNNWAVSVEYTDDPHSRNTYWEMFGAPMFDLKDPAGILLEINNCPKTFPNHARRLNRVLAWSAPKRKAAISALSRKPLAST